jgi:purine-binding chemotaxis protein CheW
LVSSESNAESSEPSGPKSLVFRVGGDLLACDIEIVREIVRFAAMTRVPGAPPFVRGLLNVRGEVLSVLDVGIRLNPEQPPRSGGSIVVAHVDGRQVGLVVDEVIGVHVLQEAPSGAPPTPLGDIVRRTGHLDGRIVLYLDVPAFVRQSLV